MFSMPSSVFFFNDTATTEIYTLSLHDALPISRHIGAFDLDARDFIVMTHTQLMKSEIVQQDRKSTRLNSSHGYISYAVFCLKKKKPHSRPREQTGPTPSAVRTPAAARHARRRC